MQTWFYIVHILENMDYIFHFGVKNGTLCSQKEEAMAHLEKLFSLSTWAYLKRLRAKDQNGNYIKFGNEEIDTNRTHLNYNLHERKMDSDYDFCKIRGNGIPC